METTAQSGVAVIFGIACILLAIGSVLFVDSYKRGLLSQKALGVFEAVIGIILVIFGIASLYLSQKSSRVGY